MGEGAFRKHDHAPAASERFRDLGRIARALWRIPALDADVARPPQETANQGIVERLAFRHEDDVVRKQGPEDDHVEVRGVIADEEGSLAGGQAQGA